MEKLNKALILFSINLLIFFCIDFLFGMYSGPLPEYLNTRGQYNTNYRNYFMSRKDQDGNTFYTPDNSITIDNLYKNKNFTKDDFVILGLGDSFTKGQGVKEKDVWIKKIENLIPNKKTYGVNLGKSGINIKLVKEEYEKVKNLYRPNLVVYAFVLNDTVSKAIVKMEMDTGHTENFSNDIAIYNDLINTRTTVFDINRSFLIDLVYKSTNIGKYLIRAIENYKVSKRSVIYYQNLHDPNKNLKGLTETYELISEMRNEVESKGGKFLVMIFPLFYNIDSNYPFLSAHNEISNSLSQRGINTLDLLPFYKKNKTESLWVHPIDQHPNDLAHDIAAKALAKWIINSKLLFP